jgi:transposase
VRALAEGPSRQAVAAVLGVHPNSVSRWVRAARRPDGLAAKPSHGPTPGLSDADLRRLEALLRQGAKAHGWDNELWTAARVATRIARHFGRLYHPDHVLRILSGRLRWTSQKPRRHARERDDQEVARWVGDGFPRIVREAFARKAHLVFLDESGFFLTPTVRRTLAPRGQTPVLPAWDRRDRLSALSAITLSPATAHPNLFFRIFPHHVRAEQVVDFLAEWHRSLGARTVVWDRGPIHDKSELVRAWRAKHPRVVTEKFPAYAPALNPDEGVWGCTRYGRLANLAANDTDDLGDHLIEELVTVKHSPDLLNGFVRQAKLPGLSLAA